MSEQDISTGTKRAICRVFISYSHDSIEHARRVLELAERLRQDGVDAQLDQYVAGTPSRGWPRWMEDKLESAQFVLVICTDTYYRRFLGHEEPNKGKGVGWEGSLVTLELYHALSDTSKFVPVIFHAQDERFIPRPLSGHTHYLLNSEDNYAKLYAFLTGQAGVVPRKLGPLKTLARELVEPLTFGGSVEETPPAAELDRLPDYARPKIGSEALRDSQSAPAGETLPSLTTKDNRLSDPDPPILEIIPYKETPTVDKLLDRIWNSLKSPPKVPDPHTYGREWILYDPKGEYFHKIGTRWAQFIENKQLDGRPLREVGITPNMTLEVRPPKQRIVIINQRPLVGGSEEPLLLEYSDLKTVGGLLNRIQISIPELSVESYGTKWILYDPGSGRYFDDIAKGDSRVLRAAGIAIEDGDTFLDVRPPLIVNPQLGSHPPDPGVAGRVEPAKVEKSTTPKVQLGFAVGFGIVGLAIILIIAIFIPVPTEFQYQVFRIILALAAGGAASMIPGILNLQISNLITASGALAVFVVVYFYSPAQLAVRGIAPHPTPTPTATSTPATPTQSAESLPADLQARLNDYIQKSKQYHLPPRVYFDQATGATSEEFSKLSTELEKNGFEIRDPKPKSFNSGAVKTQVRYPQNPPINQEGAQVLTDMLKLLGIPDVEPSQSENKSDSGRFEISLGRVEVVDHPTPSPETEIKNFSIFVDDIPFHQENTPELAIPNYKGELKWQAHGEVKIDGKYGLILLIDSTIDFLADKTVTPGGMQAQPGWAIRKTQKIPVHFNGGAPDIVSFENGSKDSDPFGQIRQTMTASFPSKSAITESVFPDSFVQDCHPTLPGPPLLLHITFKSLPLRVVRH
jgi:hypothetical protein